jgi:hypothetical protein
LGIQGILTQGNSSDSWTEFARNAVAGVSVTPGLKDGHAIASVVLLKGEEMKSVEQSLE